MSKPRAIAPDRWQRVQEVLAEAIECEIADRHGVLDARCAGDALLRLEVESLLAAHDRTGFVDGLAEAVAPAATWARAQAAGFEGRRLGSYAVLDLLGAGGMGLVYKAHDQRLDRHVALKFLPPHLGMQPAAKQRFLVEARAAAGLDHPNVCTIHEIGETDDGQLFIAMPLYDGETLQARLTRGRLPFREAVPIAVQIARGLGSAHERGIVHRDIKPSNVMLMRDGTVKILDFGIAKVDDLSLTGQGIALGTVAYMSPEQVNGTAVDHRSDIWSFGVVLHEMLTGRLPFGGDDRQAMANAIRSRDPDLTATSHPDVPSGVDGLLRRTLARRPEQRHPSMASLATDLGALASPAERPGAASPSAAPAVPGFARDAQPAGERRRVAVLVSIVSGYAALVEHLAAADGSRLVAQIRDVAVEVVRRHGGIVNQAIGEEIVSAFGLPTAHEDDDLRAVRAALELHARVRALALGAGDRAVRLQSGLHIGSVVVQRLLDGPRRYAIVGAPGTAAARLAALAGPDDVVLSPECQRLVSHFVHTVAGPPVLLEPDAQPVTPFRVTGETGLETRLEAAERTGLTPFVGRQSELALLESRVARTRAGEGGLVTVVGEAGVGKSRLLHELRERAVAAGVRVLNGRCRAYGDRMPYFPLIEVLRDALDMRGPAASDSRDIIARVRALDPALEPFLPLYLHLMSVPSESHPLPRHLQGEHLQAALLDALAAALAALAGSVTVVVLLEDWHWADAASLAALDRLTEVMAAHALLLVVTTRPERRGAADWPGHGTRIQLEPLDFRASAAIMRAALRVERVAEELERRVFERTAGNPFFIEQVCAALLEQGDVAARDREAVVAGPPETVWLPDTVQAVIRTRLDNLDSNARDALRVAAVIGRDFEHALLADALGADIDLPAAIARLKASGLVQQTSVIPAVAYRFTHVLTHEVSYDSLLGHQRKALHEVIGRAIETHHADRIDAKAALLAHHFERAGAWPDAIGYARRAAAHANALSQFADGLAMLDRALAWLGHLPDDDARRDLHAGLLFQQERECETLGLRGRQQDIVGELIAQLAPRGPSARLAEAYLRQGDLLTLSKSFHAADRALGTALRISRELGDSALERHTLRSIGLLRWHEGRHPEALAITEAALAIDRASHDELAVAGDLSNLVSILKSMGDYAGALPRLEEALAMPAIARDPRKMAYVLHNLANVHRCLGNPERALEALRRADEMTQLHLLPIQRSFHLTSIAHIDLQQGQIESAIRRYEEAIELSRRARHAQGLAQSLRTLGEVLFELDRHEEAMPRLREAAEIFAQLDDRVSLADIRSRLAAAHERSSPAEAAEAWRAAGALRRQVGDAHGELEALEGLARATRQAGPPADAIAAFEAALELAARLGETRREAVLRNVLGILEWERGAYAQALRHYEAALRLVRAVRDRAQEGLILNSLGVTLIRLRRPEEARTVLEESVALNRETGQRLLEAHATAALGEVSQASQRHDRAIDSYERALELRRSLGDRAGEGWMCLRLAEAHAALGDRAAARRAAAAATAIASETGEPALLRACAGLAPVTGQPDQAVAGQPDQE